MVTQNSCPSCLKLPLAMATKEGNTQQQITSNLMLTKRWDALICLEENFILFHSYNSDFLITGHRWQNIILLTMTICFVVHQLNCRDYRDWFMPAINRNKLVARAILQMAIDVAYSASRSFVAMTIMEQKDCGLWNLRFFIFPEKYRQIQTLLLEIWTSFRTTINVCMLQYNEFMYAALSLLIRKLNQKKRGNQYIAKLLDNNHFPFYIL